MWDLDFNVEDELDFEEEYEDAEDQADLEAAVSEAIYSTLEDARDKLAAQTTNPELAVAISEAEIVLDNYYSGRLILNDDADEMLTQEERGIPSFDIKRGLLASPKVKVTKSGIRSIVVPFKGNNRGFNPLRLGRRLATKYFEEQGSGEAESFKRVTDLTPSWKWIHPGIPPHYMFDKIQIEASNQLNSQIRDIERDFK